ncbi:hypothetical protein MPSEU_000586400 [Mayamaea pseudoterrestris]|nr:hypothetical protein MPSEU_000586400 [Mayamaea pseudoterrestris]
MSSSSESDDDDYDYVDANQQDNEVKRFPIHDCCEFEDIEALKKLLFLPVPVTDASHGAVVTSVPRHHAKERHGEDDDSSDDDSNDSTAAAHAAALGHSPAPNSMEQLEKAATCSMLFATMMASSRKTVDRVAPRLLLVFEKLNISRISKTVVPRLKWSTPSKRRNPAPIFVRSQFAPHNLKSLTMSSSSESDDDDYDYVDANQQDNEIKRFPIHDCCEFEDIEALKKLLFLPVPVTDASHGAVVMSVPRHHAKERHGEDDDSSDDDSNDSTAAAHAAALGHSPAPNMEQLEKAASATKDNGIVIEKDASAEQTNDASVEGENANATTKGPVATEANGQDESPMDVDEPETTESPVSIRKSSPAAATATTSPMPAADERPKQLLEVNPDVNLNERDEDENTPLHVAIHARKLEHVKLLLEAGASYRMKCDGSWYMHTAISMGAIKEHRQFAYDCVVVLREAGADITLKDDSMHSPLFLACMFNLPQVASYILSDEEGESTLNARADRAGNRPLHAAAKYDTPSNPSFSKITAVSATGQVAVAANALRKYSDGAIVNAVRPVPTLSGKKLNTAVQEPMQAEDPDLPHSTAALLTQVLLNADGIEVDALNALGQTPLHIACMRGNWPVVRLLMEAGADTHILDRRGYTPGQLAYKRGMFIPEEMVGQLGDAPEEGIMAPPRDLIVDPDGKTLLFSHELCLLHRSCPPIHRDSPEPPPENVRRLQVLLDPDTGILRSGDFSEMLWQGQARRAAISDVLKVHEYSYVETISQVSSSIPDIPQAVANIDPDTAISHWSFEAAMRAAGSVCEAVDKVVAGEVRNAFCAIRPPGHHAGPRGIVTGCANDPEGSHGFCLLNNVCIGAAYARSMYRHDGIKKIAIIDQDVHHGNGSEEIIRQLVPRTEKATIRTPFARGELQTSTYRPWLDETDIQNVFFASTHGYGPRGYYQAGWFYPGSGKTYTSESITHPTMVESPGLADFLLTQTWSRMGEESKANCCRIIDIGLALPDQENSDPISRGMKQRIDLRDAYRNQILPSLREFDPDIIFISAGFDAHRRDTMNFGYVGMVEDDYEWVTEQIIKVANTCCNGRVVSVLEGGYKIHGGIVSPFARSVASHVRGLVDGGKSRELYDPKDGEWESQFEHHLYERRERKKEQEREQLKLMEQTQRQAMLMQLAHQGGGGGGAPEDPDGPTRKRRRNNVDYKELYKQMQAEGFAG